MLARYIFAEVVCIILFFVSTSNGYNYVPVINFISKAAGDGSKAQSIAICRESGGFLVTEATQSIHAEVINQVKSLGVGSEWYTFLGADTLTIDPTNCRPDSLSGTTIFDSNCMWRWNQGPWLNLYDPLSEELKEDHMGVTFFKGNEFSMATVYMKGPVQGFPTWFNIDSSTDWTTRRPNVFTLRHLIAMGTNEGSTWSDNNESGGYTYANYDFANDKIHGVVSRLDLNAIAATRNKFVTICNAYAPDRSTMEQYNTTSGLQLYWWGILLAFLIVICVILFIVVAVCQEREDMDEPPEDAPEWAEEQQSNVKRSKSFVSTRSFRKYDDENNDLDNVNNGDYNNNNNKVNDNNTNAFASDDNAYNHQNAAYNSNGYNGHGNGGEDGYNQRTPSKNNNRSNYNANPLFARNPSMSEPMHPQQAMQNN